MEPGADDKALGVLSVRVDGEAVSGE